MATYKCGQKTCVALSQLHPDHDIKLSCVTEDRKLVVRLQMQNTLGIVVIGQLDE